VRYPGFQLARGRGPLQLVKNVGDVSAAMNHTHNLDHAGTLAVEDKIVAMREQPEPKSSMTKDLPQFWLLREKLDQPIERAKHLSRRAWIVT
jgi:hypothetical protein